MRAIPYSRRGAGRAAFALALVGAATGGSCKTRERHHDAVDAPPSSSPTLVEEAPSAPSCLLQGKKRLSPIDTRSASSSVALATFDEDGGATDKVVFVADEEAHALHAIDASTLREVGVTALDGKPKHVLVLSDGRVAVTLRDTARVVVLEPGASPKKPLVKRCEHTVAVDPWALAQTKGALLVTSGFGAALTVLRGSDLGVVREIRLPREPRAVLVDPTETVAYVAHAAYGSVSAVNLASPAAPPQEISLRAGKLDADSSRDDKGPREATQAYALASISVEKAGGGETFRLFVPHTSVDPGTANLGMTETYGGSFGTRPVAEIVSVIDPTAKRSMTHDVRAAAQSASTSECILPRSAVARGASLFVACLNMDKVVEYDASVADPTSLTKRSFDVPGGPSSLALDDKAGALYVWSDATRALSVIDLSTEKGRVTSVRPWERDEAPVDPKILRGRYLFETSDSRIAAGRACASCHPEGRDDGLVWSSPDGRRQTPMLAGRLADTAPYGWFGENPTLKDHVTKTMKRLGGFGMTEAKDQADLDALLTYIASLPAPPKMPAPDQALAERGKGVFEETGCNYCHENAGTDGHTHDVGSGQKSERSQRFDTPSLRGIRGSPPYFHDGRYATLDALLTATDQKMFDRERMTDSDRTALVAYLETL